MAKHSFELKKEVVRAYFRLDESCGIQAQTLGCIKIARQPKLPC